jgi:hypothetical protein
MFHLAAKKSWVNEEAGMGRSGLKIQQPHRRMHSYPIVNNYALQAKSNGFNSFFWGWS